MIGPFSPADDSRALGVPSRRGPSHAPSINKPTAQPSAPEQFAIYAHREKAGSCQVSRRETLSPGVQTCAYELARASTANPDAGHSLTSQLHDNNTEELCPHAGSTEDLRRIAPGCVVGLQYAFDGSFCSVAACGHDTHRACTSIHKGSRVTDGHILSKDDKARDVFTSAASSCYLRSMQNGITTTRLRCCRLSLYEIHEQIRSGGADAAVAAAAGIAVSKHAWHCAPTSHLLCCRGRHSESKPQIAAASESEA